MDLNSQNSSYWFVVREDQSNVIFSTNNVIQNPQIAGHEPRFIVDAGLQPQYIQEQKDEVAIDNTCAVDVDNFWDRNKVQLLLSLWRDDRFKDANNKDRTMWEQIAAIVGISETECIKKYKSLRRTYVRLSNKRRLGKNIKWIHYNVCDDVFKDCKTLSSAALVPWEDKMVRQLLTLYIENLDRFQDRNCVQRDLWKDIAGAMNTTEYNCYQKFRYLKRRYFTLLEKKSSTGRQIKWPYSQYFERIFYDYDPYICSWDSSKIKQLIDAYSQIAYKFRSPSFQKKELWKEIGEIVGKNASDCDRKFRNLKQTYIRLKMRADTGRAVTKWKYYEDFETIFSNTKVHRNGIPLNCRNQTDNYIIKLLKFVIDNLEKFKHPLRKRKQFWRLVGPKLGLTAEECDRKFRNLKQTYMRLREQKAVTGKCNKWPYYSYYEKIFEGSCAMCNKVENNGSEGVCQLCSKGKNSVGEDIDSQTISDIRKVMRDMQDRHSADKFDKLIQAVQDSNDIQRERNMILKALLDKR
ncbi:uncharacterized protein LOC106139957 [Amyelois transitella]|uniref:uncharacterized protein LOC106139957 n=1 Tax=Amyelois transitella TaxID=680683 RepID=UPI002990221A|nr:uncharacterized protein LOC106139957 [Amyelois transitella]